MRRVPESEIENDFERQLCWGDDERYFYNPNHRKASVMGHFVRIETVLSLVNRFSPGRRIADFACAQGNFGLLLAEQGYDVTAIDINERFLAYANKKHTSGKFQTVLANLMDFRDPQGFDCILAGEIIEHVAYPEQLLRSIYENLKPGGILILTTPNGAEYASPLPTFSQVVDIEKLIPRQFHWGDHLFLYTDQELRTLFTTVGLEMPFLEKFNSSFVTQLKGIRYLLPLKTLKWLEKKTRKWRKAGADSTNLIITVGKKKLLHEDSP